MYLPILPEHLEYFSCGENQLTALPVLPNNLIDLYCSFNQLSVIPILPNTITKFYCSKNKLIALPLLPDNLEQLDCGENKLTKLPILPNTTKGLYCSKNLLTKLPPLPNTLIDLYCHDNQLIELPELPYKLRNLYCNSNNLTSLKALPNTLTILNCSNNSNLSCINSWLPKELESLSIEKTAIKCLPNKPTKMQADRYLLPCDSTNVDKCLSFSNVQDSVVVEDVDQDPKNELPNLVFDANSSSIVLTPPKVSIEIDNINPELEVLLPLKLYLNANAELLFAETKLNETGQFLLTNDIGQLIDNQPINTLKIASFSLLDLPKGIYILTVKTKDRQRTAKVIKHE
jgi:hypothetical protein